MVEVPGIAVLDRDQADDRAPGFERRVQAAAHGGHEPGTTGLGEVGPADDLRVAQHLEQWWGQVLGVEGGVQAGAVPAYGQPTVLGVVEQQDRDCVEVEEFLQPLHGGVEHLVHVERGREGLRHTVQ